MEWIFLLAGLALGALLGFFVQKNKAATLLQEAGTRGLEAEKQTALQAQQAENLRQSLVQRESELQQSRIEINRLTGENARLLEASSSLEIRLKEQREDLERVRQQVKEQFTTIAAEVVASNARQIQEEHRSRLVDVLNPLRERIEKFEGQVRVTNEERIREHQSMREQLTQLQSLNKSIGEEARNLVTALKGQTKTQGNWGEMILEKVLERSGLVKGREYHVQSSFTNEEGRRLQPDVIISLPENKSVIIDAKVSLIAYERFCNEQDEAARAIALREHLSSIRKHVKELSARNYQQLYQVNSLDFVLMFVPVEPAFSVAIEHDSELFNEAFDRNIVIVTTSTLLATLRTISSIWRMEYQNKNAMEIARQAGDLYDKFSALIDNLIAVGKKINDAQESYEDAMKKLHTGRGNLISKVEAMKKLGIKASKQINSKLIERTEDLHEQPDENTNEEAGS